MWAVVNAAMNTIKDFLTEVLLLSDGCIFVMSSVMYVGLTCSHCGRQPCVFQTTVYIHLLFIILFNCLFSVC
jgi:hypothetical protein